MIIVADRPRVHTHTGGKDFVGSESKVLDRMLSHAQVQRSDVTLYWADEWDYGSNMHHNNMVVCAGEQASKAVLGWDAPPQKWHGSVFPRFTKKPTGYDAYRSWCVEAPQIVVTFGIDKLTAMYEWHPLAAQDWEKAGQVARGTLKQHDPNGREWIFDSSKRLPELGQYTALAFDTELTPSWMFGACNISQVHVTQWTGECAKHLRPIMSSPGVLKIAHNLQHDLAMCQLRFDVPVKEPWFDTYGGAHILNTALERTLSPGISSRFTNYPYHKWLSDVDMLRYNGMDNIVCFEAYTRIVQELAQRGLQSVSLHDHRLLRILFDMQMRGFRVSESERAKYEEDAQCELIAKESALEALTQPVIAAKIGKFEKPGLFVEVRKCSCCGGGKTQAQHCARCGGLPQKPRLKKDFPPEFAPGVPRTMKALTASLPVCSTCNGVGRKEQPLLFNPSSNEQVADVVYRGLGITPRRYKGKETVAATSLEKIQDKHPIIRALVEASKLRADIVTVQRMRPDASGRLHCVFDPWGTESGRVAGKEGLLQAGTNPMNIPEKARRFVIPDEGCIFLYPDMAQIEARVVARLSLKWDDRLYKAFTTPINWPGHEKHGQIDSHTFVQQMVSQWCQITRDQAKRLTYAVMYGVTAKQLAIELTNEALRKNQPQYAVSEAQAILMIEAFFHAFPGVLKWHEDVEQQLIRSRTVTSLTGRERHWPGRIMDKWGQGVARETLKEAWSFVPQDCGAWILAEGMQRLAKRPGIQGLVHVHDAVLMQVPVAAAKELIPLVTKDLSVHWMDMYFPCEMKVGMDWANMRKVG